MVAFEQKGYSAEKTNRQQQLYHSGPWCGILTLWNAAPL